MVSRENVKNKRKTGERWSESGSERDGTGKKEVGRRIGR